MSSMQPGRSRMILMLHCRKILSNTSISLLHELYSMLHRIYFDNVTVSLYNFIYNVYICGEWNHDSFLCSDILQLSVLIHISWCSSFYIHLPWNHFPLRWHGSIWRHVPKTEAICPKVRLWAAVPLHCKRPKKKTATNSKFCIDWKRSSKIYAMWKVQRLLSSSKSKFGIFPILEAHTSFVDSHWNRRHVQRRCLGALNPPPNRWERCSIHRSI